MELPAKRPHIYGTKLSAPSLRFWFTELGNMTMKSGFMNTFYCRLKLVSFLSRHLVTETVIK